MSTKKSVSLTTATAEAIQARYPQGDANYSGAITFFCERYRVMIREALGEVDLSSGQWVKIFGIYNGTVTQYDAEGVAKMLYAEVMDSQLDDDDLAAKVGRMSLCQRLAVIDMVDRFWSGDWNEYPGYDAIIEQLKKSV